MNWITNIVRPRIKGLMGKDRSSDTPDNLWKKCPSCGEMIFHRDLVANLNVCTNCGHHLRIGPAERFAYTFDAGSFTELVPPTVPADPLNTARDVATDDIRPVPFTHRIPTVFHVPLPPIAVPEAAADHDT